jgi:hypothetical protein
MTLTLQKRLENSCKETGKVVSFCNDYSGRSMYGRLCVGITGPWADCMKVISAVMQDIAAANGAHGVLQVGEWFDTLLSFDMDNMGRDIILYWSKLSSAPKVLAELGEVTSASPEVGDPCCADPEGSMMYGTITSIDTDAGVAYANLIRDFCGDIPTKKLDGVWIFESF